MRIIMHKVNQLNKYDYVLSQHLCKEHAHEFDKWWDSKKFDWKNGSDILAQYCSQHFDKWWDPDKFDWKQDSWALAKYCSRHFDKWWNCKKYNWEYSWLLAQYCSQHFNKWWNPDKFDWYFSAILAQYCSEYFNLWWDPDKFNWKKGSKMLIIYCNQYFDKWWDRNRSLQCYCCPTINLEYLYYFSKYCYVYLNKWLKNISKLNEAQLHILLTTCKIDYIMQYYDEILEKCSKEQIKSVIRSLKSIDTDKLLLVLF